MPVSCNVSKEGNQVTICINQRFDFSLHQLFRDSYSQCVGRNLNYILDLSHIDYMDSSALGMILLLKDHAELHASTLVIKNPNDAVYKILEIAQFHRLMTIEH